MNFVNNIENSNIVKNNYDFFEVSAKNDINLNNLLFSSMA